VTVFVRDFELGRYQEAFGLAGAEAPFVIVAEPGIRHARNVVTRHYPHGTRVVAIDDDIQKIFYLNGENKLEEVHNLAEFLADAWDMAGCRLWGVNPTGNPFYMRHKTRHGLVFAIGNMHGYTVDHTMPELQCEVKEDYERTLLYWLADGAVCRFDWVTNNNRYAKLEGGCGKGPERDAGNRLAAAQLVERFPGLVSYKKGSDTEVKLLTPKW
jgi:hypothetical protein